MKIIQRIASNFVVLVLPTIFCLLCCGCNPYAEKQPKLNADEIWICDEAPMYFLGFNEELGYPPGFVVIDGNLKTVEAGFLSGGKFVAIEISEGNTKILFNGICAFKEDSFVVKEILTDRLFNSQYKTITFRLYYEDEVDWVDGWPVPKEGQER